MSERASVRRIVRGLVAAAFVLCGASALAAIGPVPAWANNIHCDQVAYEPGPWGSAPGLYKSCHDDQGNHVPPPDGSNEAWDYMHRHR
jgi:hypothetical protein